MKRTVLLPRAKNSNGFTLLELLVVLVIIGLVFAVVTLTISFGDEDQLLDIEAQHLRDLAILAEDRAVLAGEPLGLHFSPPDTEPGWGYQWLRYRGGQWLAAGEPLGSRQLPQDIELSLEVEGEQVFFERLDNNKDGNLIPSIVFFPGGEVTPFYLTLFNAQQVDEQRILSSRRLGRVEIEEDESL